MMRMSLGQSFLVPLFCGILVVFAQPVLALPEEVTWLARAVEPPLLIPAPARPLSPLLQKQDGSLVLNSEDWQPQRAKIKEAWLNFLGPLPHPATGFDLKATQSDSIENVQRDLVEYTVEPGRRVTAAILRPRHIAGKLPGLVLFHGTSAETFRPEAGLGTRTDRNTGLKLASLGFVVICPANFLWEQSSLLASTQAARQRHPDSLGMATMLADGMRAVDLLIADPDVDSKRIGVLGHSLGGKEALYLLAFDDRVRAGVASEGGIGLGSSNWDALWYLGPAVKDPGFPRDHHELLGLIAPRPFLVLAGEEGPGCADGDRSWPYLLAGQEVSRLFGKTVRQGVWNHHEGHQYSQAAQEKAFEWLTAYVALSQSE